MKTAAAILFYAAATLGASAAILDELSGAAAECSAVQMRVSQEKFSEFFDAPVKSLLDITVSFGGKMRIQTLQPFEAVSIFDGENFARYEKDGGKWRRLSDANPAMAKLVFGQMSKLYTGGVSASLYEIREESDTVILVPKNVQARKFVREIRISTELKDGRRSLKKITVSDADGDSTQMGVLSQNLLRQQPDAFDINRPEPPEK
mgnify:CR=1 FL=1